MRTAHATRVVAAIGRGVQADLGPITVVTGRNGLGKSTLLGALSLALAGFVPDILGRDEVRSPGTLRRVLGSGGSPVGPIEVHFSDGATAHWSGFGRTGASVPNYVTDASVTAYRHVASVLSGDPDKSDALRRYILRIACRDMGAEDFRKRIPGDLLPVYDEIVRASPSPVEGFLLVIESLRDLISRQRADLAADQRVYQELAATTAAAEQPSEAAIADVQARANRLRTLIGYKDVMGQIAAVEAQGTQAVAHRAALTAELGRLPAVGKPPGDLTPEQNALMVLLGISEQRGDPQCALCGTPRGPSQTQHMADLLGRGRAFIASRREAQDSHAALVAARTRGEAAIARVNNEISALEGQLAVLRRLLPPTGIRAEDFPGIDLQAPFPPQLAAAEAALAAHQQMIGARRREAEIEKRIAVLADKIEKTVALERTLAKLAPEIIRERRVAFEQAVSRWIGPDETGNAVSFQLLLHDPQNPEGEAQVSGICRWGWSRDGVLVENLSAAQRVRTILAVALAAIPPRSAGYHLMLVDGADFDADTLSDVLAVLADRAAELPAQIVIANATPPTVVPEGVAHIDLDNPDTATTYALGAASMRPGKSRKPREPRKARGGAAA